MKDEILEGMVNNSIKLYNLWANIPSYTKEELTNRKTLPMFSLNRKQFEARAKRNKSARKARRRNKI